MIPDKEETGPEGMGDRLINLEDAMEWKLMCENLKPTIPRECGIQSGSNMTGTN